MQKLVTIYLESQKNNGVEEHLSDYLGGGWRIVSVCPMGGTSHHGFTYGWISVLLEKDISAIA